MVYLDRDVGDKGHFVGVGTDDVRISLIVVAETQISGIVDCSATIARKVSLVTETVKVSPATRGGWGGESGSRSQSKSPIGVPSLFDVLRLFDVQRLF